MKVARAIGCGLVLAVLGVTLGVSVNLWERFDARKEQAFRSALRTSAEEVEAVLFNLDQRLVSAMKAGVTAFRQGEAVMGVEEGQAVLGAIDASLLTVNRAMLYIETLYTVPQVDDYLARMRALYNQTDFVIYDLSADGSTTHPINATDIPDRLPIQASQRIFPLNFAGTGRFPRVGSRDLRPLNLGTSSPEVLDSGHPFFTNVSCRVVGTADTCSIVLSVPDTTVRPVDRVLMLSFVPESLVPLLSSVAPVVRVDIADAAGQSFFRSRNVASRDVVSPALNHAHSAAFRLPMANTHWVVNITLLAGAVSVSEWETLKELTVVEGALFGGLLSLTIVVGIEVAARKERRTAREAARKTVLESLSHTIQSSLHRLSMAYALQDETHTSPSQDPNRTSTTQDPSSSETKEPSSHHPPNTPSPSTPLHRTSSQRAHLCRTSRRRASLSSGHTPSIAHSTFALIRDISSLMRLLTRRRVEPVEFRLGDLRADLWAAPPDETRVECADTRVWRSDRQLIATFLVRLLRNAHKHGGLSQPTSSPPSSQPHPPASVVGVRLGLPLAQVGPFDRQWGVVPRPGMLHFAVESPTHMAKETMDRLGSELDNSHGFGYVALVTIILEARGYLGVKQDGDARFVAGFGLPASVVGQSPATTGQDKV